MVGVAVRMCVFLVNLYATTHILWQTYLADLTPPPPLLQYTTLLEKPGWAN